MDLDLLSGALAQIKVKLERAITSGSYGAKTYRNGREAKQALIRSQKLINLIHEVVKTSIDTVLASMDREYEIHPEIGRSSPELSLTGFIKRKKQDVVVLFDGDRPSEELVRDDCPLRGAPDKVGKRQSERSLVIGVRSQLSSVAKNFDTLMERAFAETLNLRLRLPGLIMGEVYLLPVVEYDDAAMVENRIAFKQRMIPLEKFIKTFAAISGKRARTQQELYKYDRTALILVDFRTDSPVLLLTAAEIRETFGFSSDVALSYESLSPVNFAAEIVRIHAKHNRSPG